MVWNDYIVSCLKKNTRLGPGLSNVDEVRDFVEWILKVRDEKLGVPYDWEAIIDMHTNLLINDTFDPIDAIFSSSYSRIHEGSIDSLYFYDRAVIAPTNKIVDKFNEHTLVEKTSFAVVFWP